MNFKLLTLLFSFLVATFLSESVSARGIKIGGFRGGKISGGKVPSRPNIPKRPSRPSYPSRTVYIPKRSTVIRTGSTITIRRRPSTTHLIIYPVYHPVPIWSIYVPIYHHTGNSKPVTIKEGACIKGGVSLFETCQAQSTKRFSLSNQNATWQSCCANYAEVQCYIDKAADFCSEDDAKTLIEHSQEVANFFGSTICKAVQFITWDSTCANETAEAQAFNSNPSLTENFISLPPVMGTEKTCFDKLKTQKDGDFTEKCLNASLNNWDTDRRKLWTSQVSESCCSFYDAMDCLYQVSEPICSTSERKGLLDYRSVSVNAFSQGICRAVKYEHAPSICHGEPDNGSLTTLPSFVLLIGLIAASLGFYSN